MVQKHVRAYARIYVHIHTVVVCVCESGIEMTIRCIRTILAHTCTNVRTCMYVSDCCSLLCICKEILPSGNLQTSS